MGTKVLRHFGVKAGWVLAKERHGGSGKFIDQRWRDLSTFKDYWGGLIGENAGRRLGYQREVRGGLRSRCHGEGQEPKL